MTNPDYTYPIDPFELPETVSETPSSSDLEQLPAPLPEPVEIEDCPEEEATLYVLSFSDEVAAQHFVTDRKVALQTFLSPEELHELDLDIVARGNEVHIISCSGEPIRVMNRSAAHILKSSGNIRFKK